MSRKSIEAVLGALTVTLAGSAVIAAVKATQSTDAGSPPGGE